MKPTFYKIEKGVPMQPAIPRSIVREALKKLRVGDSFLAPPTQTANAYRLAEAVGIKIAIRSVNGAIRIWRVGK